MDEVINNLVSYLADNLPKFLTAIGVLLIGFLVALIIAKVVRTLLRRTNLDNRLANLVAGDQNAQSPRVENFISQVVFYLLLAGAFVAFFSTLGIPQVTQPVSDFLNGFFQYLPNIVGAVVLLVIAMFVANVARMLAKRAMDSFGFEEKVKSKVEVANDKIQEASDKDPKLAEKSGQAVEKAQSLSFTDILANILYYLVIILFLPAIIGTLNLGGVLAPVQNLANRFLDYIPNLLAAAAIFVVGYFAARILRTIAVTFFRAVGLDTLGERVGLSGMIGGKSLSDLAGTIVYILILLPIIVAGLNALNIDAVTTPASNLINQVLGALPAMFGAVLLLVLAFVVGKIVAEVLAGLLTNLGFDSILQRVGLAQAHAQVEASATTPSKAVGNIALAYIMVFATIEALGLVGFNQLADLLTQFVGLTGNVLIGLAVFAVGMLLAQFAANTIRNSNIASSDILAPVARIAITVLAGAMALGQMGLAPNIVTLAFGLSLGAIAVAFAIAFGLGGREAASQIANDMVQKIRNRGQ